MQGLPVAEARPPAPPARSAVRAARRGLLDRQRPDGHWVGELQGDTILESEFVLLMAFLGRLDDPAVRKAANYIRGDRQPGAAWSNYPGGPTDVSVSVKAYFALKLAGDHADEPAMAQARAAVRAAGGAEACNSFTKFYLALLGEFPYRNCPAVPPELVLLPRWFYVNIYAMSSWTRTILVPLSIFYAHKPVAPVPAGRGIRELFLAPPEVPRWPCPPTRAWCSWTNLFLGVDWLIKRAEPLLGPVRRHAVNRAAAWMRDHFRDSDGVGAIYPPIIYTIISLRCLGVADGDPEMQWAVKQLTDLFVEDDDTLKIEPCKSPVWDTALTLIALADAGVTDTPATRAGVDWLLQREVRCRGDWSVCNPQLEPGGWFFEYQNAFYPDTDDTAMVLMALGRHNVESAAVNRAVAWLLGLQNRDGGWAAFDRDIDRAVLEKVPFADHNAMLDPSCPDITARVIEAIAHHGHSVEHPAVMRGLQFLRRTQDVDGKWPGRWGVNYLYGTWQVLQGLAAIGFPDDDPMVRRAVAWLKSVQQPSGAWGESCGSYDDPKLAGVGEATASQTAWGLLGLVAAGEAASPEATAAAEWLMETQQTDGSWAEDAFTGTGFPKVFYLKYHYYPLYFPLMALARWQRGVESSKF